MEFDSPLILDGGLATELERSFGKDLSGRLWSAQCLDQDPGAIRAVHQLYYEAGADVATTASYQASIQGFLNEGYSRNDAVRLMRKSVQLAHEARKAHGQGLVALSMGCYGAVLANGAEYTGNYGVHITIDDLVTFHRERLSICLQEPGINFILFETIPSYLEAQAIRKLIQEEKELQLPPVAVSFSCRSNDQISDGTPLQKCLDTLVDEDIIFGIGVNCTKPKFIPGLLDILLGNKNNKKAILLYPDGGEEWDAIARSWNSETKMPTDVFGHSMAGWAKEIENRTGQKVLLGGCCGCGPSHISCIRNGLSSSS
ncbi:Homocysteine S-methyltransferase [Circinella umbellata]|nr:Homocysteine S-methyltransferase [Circinella umbellata]